MKLKHELFCRAMIKHLGHQTDAYLEVYGCKRTSAASSASRLLKKRVVIKNDDLDAGDVDNNC